MVRLTVVTTVGLIGMATTGFLGMNLIAEADGPFVKTLHFSVSFDPNDSHHSVYDSQVQAFSEFLEKISDEHTLWRAKLSAFLDVWRTKHDR